MIYDSNMDAVNFLIKEHDTHRALLSQALEAETHFKSMRRELIHHVNMEEAILFPNLLRIEVLKDYVTVAWEEHNLIMQLLQELDQFDYKSTLWVAKFEVLKKLVLSHMQDEEEKIFPLIDANSSHEFLKDVYEQMCVQKESTNSQEIIYPERPGSHHLTE